MRLCCVAVVIVFVLCDCCCCFFVVIMWLLLLMFLVYGCWLYSSVGDVSSLFPAFSGVEGAGLFERGARDDCCGAVRNGT